MLKVHRMCKGKMKYLGNRNTLMEDRCRRADASVLSPVEGWAEIAYFQSAKYENAVFTSKIRQWFWTNGTAR